MKALKWTLVALAGVALALTLCEPDWWKFTLVILFCNAHNWLSPSC